MAKKIYIFAGSSAGYRLKSESDVAFLYFRSLVAKEPPVYEFDLDDYAAQFMALLPRGPAWDDIGQELFRELIYGIAAEYKRVSDKMIQLENETFPPNTTQLLIDWERVLGLPDECTANIAQSTAERRAAVVTKFSTLAEPTPDFFVNLAAQFGYSVEVVEYFPARAGIARVGDRINGDGYQFTWSIRIPGTYTQAVRARVGDTLVGDRIATWGDGSLECLMRQYKPAHTTLTFIYD